MKKTNKRTAPARAEMSFCDIGAILDTVTEVLPIQKAGFQDMVVQVASAVDVAGPADIARRLADEAGIPIERARAVIRALRVLAKNESRDKAA